MPDSGSWDPISGAGSSPVVLSVDFPVRWRHQAGFLDLAARIGPGYRFLQTKPPVARACYGWRADAYVGPWLNTIQQDRHQVLAVLGCGVGSVYAAAIAEGISRWQAMPKIILFDPQFSSIELLCLEFNREIDAISSLLGDDEIERARKAASEFSQAASPDVAGAAAEMVESYLKVIGTPFERVGLGDARGNKFTVLFESYMSWLSAADQIDPSPAWKRSTGITSSGYAGLPACPGDRGLIGQVISFDVSRADLLRSEPVAQAVLGLLETRQGR